MKPLPLLILHSQEPGLIQVNERAAGEVGEASSSVCIPLSPTGNYYITFIPLADKSNMRCYSVTKKILFADGVLQASPSQDLDIIVWPGNMYQMLLAPGYLPVISEERFPFTIAHIDWVVDKRYTATLFWDDALCIAIEDAHGGMVFGHTLLADSRSGSLRLLKAENESLLIVSGSCERGEYLLCLGMREGECKVLLEMQSDSFRWDNNEKRFTCVQRLPTYRMHEQRSQYVWSEGEWLLQRQDAPAPTRSIQTPQDAVHAFADALVRGFTQEAMGYMSRSLVDGLDCETLQSFLGPFTHYTLPDFASSPEEGEVVLGVYTKERPFSHGRLFALAVERDAGLHISNIREW